ncbi:Thioredoxin-like 3-3 [Acorus calamus]|uniref:Thioredoxin-like 3-3 n=1 Tax=Acorus calamus TaxID=4465 RepID=A0AAV9CJP4_ACOCL|nr:Thioredoxin-like 3-3 [Acorus calamus]
MEGQPQKNFRSASNDDNLKLILQEIKTSKAPAVINYGAAWCSVCSQILPAFSQLSKEFPKLSFVYADIDECPETTQHIRYTPTFHFFRNVARKGNRSLASGDQMDDERLNLPTTSAVTIEVLGHHLHLSQDPNSKHLGTTVWDASMVFVKFLEKNCRRGRFCPAKLKGKRVIELGAGCGLAGLGMALLGCDVVSTDQVEVLPLLMRNIERNTSRVVQAYPDQESFGSITVAELDWGNEDHIKSVEPPFDYIIGTDVVYAEHLLEPLLQTILALSGPRTTVLLGYEIRSTAVHEQMIQMWKRNFDVKTVPKAKMDSKYQHSSIQLFIMELKHQAGSRENTNDSQALQVGENVNVSSKHDNNEDEEDNDAEEMLGCTMCVETGEGEVQVGSDETKKVEDEWEARRYGAMAARLLRDVKIDVKT